MCAIVFLLCYFTCRSLYALIVVTIVCSIGGGVWKGCPHSLRLISLLGHFHPSFAQIALGIANNIVPAQGFLRGWVVPNVLQLPTESTRQCVVSCMGFMVLTYCLIFRQERCELLGSIIFTSVFRSESSLRVVYELPQGFE